MRLVTTPAIAIRHWGMYKSLLELHLFLNVAVVAKPGALRFQEKLIISSVRLVTLAAHPCFKGSMSIREAQCSLRIPMTLKAQLAFCFEQLMFYVRCVPGVANVALAFVYWAMYEGCVKLSGLASVTRVTDLRFCVRQQIFLCSCM